MSASMVKPRPMEHKEYVPKKKKRYGLRKMSEKRRAENEIYSKLRIVFLKQHPLCELRISSERLREDSKAQCAGRSSTVHHAKGHGKYFLDVKTWKAACWFPCHDWVERHKREARALGLITYK